MQREEGRRGGKENAGRGKKKVEGGLKRQNEGSGRSAEDERRGKRRGEE